MGKLKNKYYSYIKNNILIKDVCDKLDIVAGYQHGSIAYVYQGVATGDLRESYLYNENIFGIFLMESAWKPIVNVSRSKISGLPLYALLAVNSIMTKYHILDDDGVMWLRLGGWKDRPLKEWRVMKNSHFDRWLWKNLADFFTETKQILQQKLQSNLNFRYTAIRIT